MSGRVKRVHNSTTLKLKTHKGCGQSNFSVADIPCMGVGGLVPDGDLFEPVVAMETEQEGYDIKGLTLYNYNTCTHNKDMYVV